MWYTSVTRVLFIASILGACKGQETLDQSGRSGRLGPAQTAEAEVKTPEASEQPTMQETPKSPDKPASMPPKPEPTLPPVTLVKPFLDTYGCRPPYGQPWVCENVSLNGQEQGSFLTALRPGARYLLAAPHGWFDAGTDAITASIFPAEIPQGLPMWSQLIAHSFRGNAPSGLSHNVNRPSLLNNDTCQAQPELAVSRMVYDRYRGHMDRLAARPALYFEIHGQSEVGLENTIEAAARNITAAEAEAVRKIMNEELQKAGITGIRVLIEPVDTVFFNAGLTKLCGSMGHIGAAPSIHTEIPRILREGDAAQLRTAKFYREVLMRLSKEVFTPERPQIMQPAGGAALIDFEVIPSRGID